MPVSAAEVDELRRECQAMTLDFSKHVLNGPAEIIGGLIFELRTLGADEGTILDSVELLARSSDMTREELREARDVLRSLHYTPELIKLLTALARRAKPREVYQPGLPRRRALRGRSRDRSAAFDSRPDEVKAALELLMPWRPKKAR